MAKSLFEGEIVSSLAKIICQFRGFRENLCIEEKTAYAEYEKTGEAIPVAAVEEWVRSWGTSNELPPPVPCKLSS